MKLIIHSWKSVLCKSCPEHTCLLLSYCLLSYFYNRWYFLLYQIQTNYLNSAYIAWYVIIKYTQKSRHNSILSFFSPRRILLFTNGCLHILETKHFLLIQVRIIQSACAHKWRRTGNALVPTSRGEGELSLVVFDSYVLRQQSVTLSLLLLLNKHPQLKKVKGTLVRWDHQLNQSSFSQLYCFCCLTLTTWMTI